MDLLNVYGSVIFSAAVSTIKELVIAAIKEKKSLTGAGLHWANLAGAVLTGANLTGAVLTGANLTGAVLTGADLTGADLTGANLYGANLTGAVLTGANLTGADLTGADLTGADLYGANLYGANLTGADLTGADLTGADLTGANLYGANLYGVKNFTYENLLIVPETGSFHGWKKLRGGVIAELLIPARAGRINSTGRKCRAEYVKVLKLYGGKVGVSSHDGKTKYVVGKIVRPDSWDPDFTKECTHGIHFFLRRSEAEEY